jgi:hypothetical protein
MHANIFESATAEMTDSRSPRFSKLEIHRENRDEYIADDLLTAIAQLDHPSYSPVTKPSSRPANLIYA